MLKLDKDGNIWELHVDGRRFVVCGEPVRDAFGRELDCDTVYCGALIDVTDRTVIRATDSCGNPTNHQITDPLSVGGY